MPEPDYRVVVVCKADPIHRGNTVPSACIDITEPMPEFAHGTVLIAPVAFFRQQAEAVHKALGSLPGGTLDQLFAVMAAERASILRVPRPVQPEEATEPGPTRAEAAARCIAVLEIHKPCHTATSECVRFHELTDKAECVGCGYQGSYEAPVDYPCETAQALGVTA